MDMLGVLYNTYPIGIHNIIVDVFDLVLKYGKIFSLHAIYHIKQQLFIKPLAPICNTDGTPFRVVIVCLGPSLELLHGNIIFPPKSPLITSITSIHILALQKDLSIYFTEMIHVRWYQRIYSLYLGATWT